MATIKDVAALAGVSLGTASRVLSGSSQTSPDSRARVTAAAKQLNYIANGPARSLRRSRTDVLGLLVSDIRNPFFSELAHAAEREAQRRGYTVLLANADEDAEQEAAYLRTFASQRIDGLLIAPQGSDVTRLRSLRDSGLPLVFVDRSVEGLEVPTVATDNEDGVRRALTWLHERGHREVAFVGGPPEISTGRERRAAFLRVRDELGLSADPRLIAHGDFRAESGVEAMRAVLSSNARPTAVLSADGLMTLGVARALREDAASGLGAVEIVSFDDLDWFSLVSPPISAVRNDATAIGRLGVEALVDVIEGRPGASHQVATSFVDRSGGDRRGQDDVPDAGADA
ncbi:LacI family DNA-binding transcriptional regulator [Promicromonospora sp. NPDC052451]|uniref:LacI family DNA-binding transcriptional regulator n=1 Tax=Promicromonospora sp. NPDC052451 TaxID=3364407 RepID=UPI0037C52FEE